MSNMIVSSGRALLSSRGFVIASDTFDRDNSATSIGSAQTGQLWTPFANGAASCVMGVSNKKAYLVSVVGGNEYGATMPCGLSDGIVAVTCNAQASGQLGVLVRVQDTTNYFVVKYRLDTNQFNILRNLAGVRATRVSQAITLSAGADVNLRVVMQGSTMYCYVNDVLQSTYTDTNMQTATKHGLYSGVTGTGVNLDNFSFKRAS